MSERAERLKGWQDAINSVRASLQQYPNAGGDITIMAEVERILAAKDAWADTAENYSILLKAAERERDSLREAYKMACKTIAVDEFDDVDKDADAIAVRTEEHVAYYMGQAEQLLERRAALKAGKETKE